MKSDEVMLRELLVEEEKAVKDYIEMADKIRNEAIKKVLLDIADEEKVHIGELLRCLKELGVCDKPEIKQGKHEANSKMMSDRLGEIQMMLGMMAMKHGTLPDQVMIVPAQPEEPIEVIIEPEEK